MKIIDLINAKNAFNLNSKFDGDMQLAFKVVKFVKDIETETDFYNKKYTEIITAYSRKDENGHVIQSDSGIAIDKNNINKFTEEVTELNSVDVEKPNVEFTIEELNKCDLTGNGLYALYPFIKEI